MKRAAATFDVAKTPRIWIRVFATSSGEHTHDATAPAAAPASARAASLAGGTAAASRRAIN